MAPMVIQALLDPQVRQVLMVQPDLLARKGLQVPMVLQVPAVVPRGLPVIRVLLALMVLSERPVLLVQMECLDLLAHKA